MKKDYYLTIVVPVYNIEVNLLKESLDSIVNSLPDRCEVIIVDDGSTNGAEVLCDSYSGNSNCRVFHQPNQGVSVARNKGIVEAKSTYITFVDSDDIVDLQAILKATEITFMNDYDIGVFKFRRDTEFKNNFSNLIKITELSNKDIKENIYNIAFQKEKYAGYCLGSPWGKIFNTRFLQKYDLKFEKSLRKMQDRVFMMNCLENSPKIALIPVEGYCYFRNELSIVNNYNKKIGEYLNNVFLEINRFNNEYCEFSVLQMNNIGCRLLLEYLSINILHTNNPENLIEKSKTLRNYLKSSKLINCLSVIDKNGFDRNEIVKLKLIKYKLYILLILISWLNSRNNG